VALAVLPPPWACWLAGAVALLAFAGSRWVQGRALLALSAVACMVAAAVLTVVIQVRHHYPAGSSWPHNFETVGVLAFCGVVALASETAVETLRAHHQSHEQEDDPQA
jgi:fatty-acid desaturase